MICVIADIVIIFILVWASIIDFRYKEVPDFLWIVILLPEAVFLYLYRDVDFDLVISLAIFFLMQEAIMTKGYGRADSHAFCSCSLGLSLLGGSLGAYTLHMTITFLLLALVQGVKQNITLKGRLKKEVAMIPYITIGYCISHFFILL